MDNKWREKIINGKRMKELLGGREEKEEMIK